MKLCLSAITALVLSTLTAANPAPAPTGNFQYLATASITGTAHASAWTSALASISSSAYAQPAYTSFQIECTDTYSLLPTQASIALDQYDCDPLLLVSAAADPTTTPAWITQLPADMSSYIESLGSVVQGANQKINGNAAGGLAVSLEAVFISIAMAVVAYL